ncbi:MAG: hypothetical protein V4641_16225 [Pseudomonadota bacterium]
MDVPIVTIQIERMRASLKMAMFEHNKLLGDEMQKAIDEAIQPEAIAILMRQQVKEHLDAAIKQEVRDFFSYTAPGRKAIKEAVRLHLNQIYPTDNHDA